VQSQNKLIGQRPSPKKPSPYSKRLTLGNQRGRPNSKLTKHGKGYVAPAKTQDMSDNVPR